MSRNKGLFYEDLACKFLQIKGYKIVFRNFKSKFGEIDIIARDGDIICFVEVKARQTNSFYKPEEAVNKIKQNRIKLAAKNYIKKLKKEYSFRFDVLSIEYFSYGEIFHHFIGAFSL